MKGALDGIRVAAFTHFAAGPRVVQFLGALGADVIKVEPPGGEISRTLIRDGEGRFGGKSPSFVTLNRNQRDIALDLKSDGGREVAWRLIESSDVLVENFKPGTLARLGFGYEAVRARNPRLVYCPISGYNRTGPRAGDLGQDMLLQGASGMASLSGRAGTGPTPVGIFCVDAYTAACNVIAILAALRYREASGEGQLVHADMLSCAMHMMLEECSWVLNIDPVLTRSRPYSGHPISKAPYGAYTARDGEFVLSVASAAQLRTFVEELGLWAEIGDCITDAGQNRERDRIGEALTRRFATMTVADIAAAAAKAGIWMGPVRSLAQALEDPAVVASGLVGQHETGEFGTYRFVKEPLTLTSSPLDLSRPAPTLGEHTREILADLGYGKPEIAKLIADGAAVAAD